jgi:ribosome biogenesis GTPase A
VEESGKKIVYVLNKTDLIPADNVEAWLAKFKSSKKLCMPF